MTSRRSSHRHVMEALRGFRSLDLGACARPLLSQHLGLRRARVVQSAVHQPPDDFEAKVQKAADENRITGARK